MLGFGCDMAKREAALSDFVTFLRNEGFLDPSCSFSGLGVMGKFMDGKTNLLGKFINVRKVWDLVKNRWDETSGL